MSWYIVWPEGSHRPFLCTIKEGYFISSNADITSDFNSHIICNVDGCKYIKLNDGKDIYGNYEIRS